MARFTLPIVFLLALAFFTGCGNKEEAADEPKPVDTPTKIEPINFGSATFGSVSDIDGNTYKTVVIGGATWMAQNLKTTKFKNGDPLLKLAAGSEWLTAGSSGYFAYNDHEGMISVYGYLYNGYAKSDARGVCPSGWHVAKPGDWTALAAALGGEGAAGGRMKEQGTAHWATINNSDNQSGFTGVPGGSMYRGALTDMGTDGYHWSTGDGDFFYLTNNQVDLRHKNTALMTEGLSIRCVKD
jgi:uncharacterized protein (TIGR02145 family)